MARADFRSVAMIKRTDQPVGDGGLTDAIRKVHSVTGNKAKVA
jgi:hypothetical protein